MTISLTTKAFADHKDKATRPRGMVKDRIETELYLHLCWHSLSQDNTRISPKRPTGNDAIYNTNYQEDFSHGDMNHDRSRRRSRSPKRERRGRYVDRDGENYESPVRSRSRSRSPYYGGAPNRNVILEGIPTNMTQEDVGRPFPTPLRTQQKPRFSILLSVYCNYQNSG